MSKRILASASALAFGAFIAAGAASAADLSVVAPPVEQLPGSAAVLNWTGFHIGGHAGYGWSTASAAFASGAPNAANLSPNGFLGGGQIGYDWQFESGLVAGIEVDGSFANLSGNYSGVGAGGGTANVTQTISAMASVRARLGFAAGRWLPYVTAGWQGANSTRHAFGTLGGPYDGSASNWHSGWTAGVGAEYAVNTKWSLRAEYRYADLGTKNYMVPGPGGQGTNVHLTTNIFTVGVNYRF